MELVSKLLELLQNVGPYVAAANGVIVAVIALCVLIPGEQPEKALKAISDVLAKVSRK